MTMRVGVLGSGWAAETHLKALAKLPEAKPVAVAGIDEPRVKALADAHGLAAYADPKAMVDAEKLDAVWVCVPPPVHGPFEDYCAGRVKGVMVEKPVARHVRVAEGIRDAFARAGTVGAGAYNLRHRPSARRARDHFAAAKEKPVFFHAQWIGSAPGSSWWRSRAQSGGQLVEQATHLADLGRWLVGDVDTVTAAATRAFMKDAPDYDLDDAIAVTLHFKSGAVGTMDTGCFAHWQIAPGIRMMVASRDCRADFDGGDLALTLNYIDDKPAERVVTPELATPEDLFALEDADFLRAVAANDPQGPACPYADAVETLRLTLAINHAAATGQPVKVSEFRD